MTTSRDCSAEDLGEKRPQAGATSAGPTAQRPARVLVVDDLPDNRHVLSRRLAKRGFSVVEAEGGLRALELVEQGDFDLVLLDLMMPDISGVDVLRRIRQFRSRFELPVIVVSAKCQSESIVECLNLDASDYVIKPVDFDVLLARMRPQLALKRNIYWRQEARRRLEDQVAELQNVSGAVLQSLRSLSSILGEHEEASTSHSGGIFESGDQTTQARRVYRSGKIVFNGRSSVIDCIVWKQSHRDALLRVESDQGLPEEFDLVVGHSAPLNCQVVTRGVNEIGVRFLGRQPSHGSL